MNGKLEKVRKSPPKIKRFEKTHLLHGIASEGHHGVTIEKLYELVAEPLSRPKLSKKEKVGEWEQRIQKRRETLCENELIAHSAQGLLESDKWEITRKGREFLGCDDWHDFEDRVKDKLGKLLGNLGYKVTETGRGPDGGIDLTACSEDVLYRSLYIIQCKKWGQTVGVGVARELLGVVTSRRATKGILIAERGFTSQARDFAKSDKYRIDLIEWWELKDLPELELGSTLRPEISEDARVTSRTCG